MTGFSYFNETSFSGKLKRLKTHNKMIPIHFLRAVSTAPDEVEVWQFSHNGISGDSWAKWGTKELAFFRLVIWLEQIKYILAKFPIHVILGRHRQIPTIFGPRLIINFWKHILLLQLSGNKFHLIILELCYFSLFKKNL